MAEKIRSVCIQTFSQSVSQTFQSVKYWNKQRQDLRVVEDDQKALLRLVIRSVSESVSLQIVHGQRTHYVARTCCSNDFDMLSRKMCNCVNLYLSYRCCACHCRMISARSMS